MDGVLRRMLMPSEALTARRAGREAEKTNEGPLIRYNKIERRHEKHSVNIKKRDHKPGGQ